jgi:hypothetical protein
MPIPGQENINIGAQNEAANSDSLFTAFNKAQNNFTTLFSESSQFTNFAGTEGISTSLNNNTKTVTINNTGVTKLTAGTGIAVNTSNGNVVISVAGSGNGALVAGVTNVGITSSTLQILNSPIVSSGTIGVDLPILGNVIPGTYSNPLLQVDSYGRITSVQNTFSTGTVTSVELQNGPGISVSGGPIISNGTITVTNTGVRRLNPGPGILLTDTTGEITISANLSTFTGTVSRVTVTSNSLTVSNPTITLAGNINIELPTNVSVIGNVTGGGNFNVGQNLSAQGNISTSNNLTVSGNASISGNATFTGNVTAQRVTATGNIAFTGANVSLGNVASVKMTGGVNGYILQTDGAGNLSWVLNTQSIGTLGAVGANTQLLFNDGGSVGANANLTFNKTNGRLTATAFTGDGTFVTNVSANTANFATNVLGASQGNITSLGTLTTLSVNGNLNISNGNITAANANLSIRNINLNAGNINTNSGNILAGAGNITAASVSVTGTITSNGFMYASTPANGTSNTQVATTQFVSNAIGNIQTYAPINSPIFTGTPQAPTIAQNVVGSNALATTAYVKTAVSEVGVGVPVGVIVAWSGTIANIPSGWVLCDGQNDTPDLRDKFVIGASQDNAGIARTNVTGSLTTAGGTKDAVVVSHTHTINDPGHAHNPTSGINFVTNTFSGDGTIDSSTIRGTLEMNLSKGATTVNNTEITINSFGVSGTNQNLPPYYALAYIMNRNAPSSNQTLDLSIYATTASPTLTGTPAAPTASTNTNSSQIATTAFVKNSLLETGALIRVTRTTANSVAGSGTLATPVKYPFDTVTFDTNNMWDSANTRINPKTPGYYRVDAILGYIATGTAGFTTGISIYKNGSSVTRSQFLVNYASSYNETMTISDVITCNGTTDYIEIYWGTNSATLTAPPASGTTVALTVQFIRSL